MRKNIFALLAVLGLFGFVSCDAGRDAETIEPQNQQEESWQDDSMNDSMNSDEGYIDEQQQQQEDDSLLQDEEGFRDDSAMENTDESGN